MPVQTGYMPPIAIPTIAETVIRVEKLVTNIAATRKEIFERQTSAKTKRLSKRSIKPSY